MKKIYKFRNKRAKLILRIWENGDRSVRLSIGQLRELFALSENEAEFIEDCYSVKKMIIENSKAVGRGAWRWFKRLIKQEFSLCIN